MSEVPELKTLSIEETMLENAHKRSVEEIAEEVKIISWATIAFMERGLPITSERAKMIGIFLWYYNGNWEEAFRNVCADETLLVWITGYPKEEVLVQAKDVLDMLVEYPFIEEANKVWRVKTSESKT